MDAATMSTPAVLIETILQEKGAESLGASCDDVATDAKVDLSNAKSDPMEPPIRLPQDWSNKRKWLIVTAISAVSFMV
jgi:hypothetical protein